MGEVWRAEDVKLGREVAIKVLPAAFTEDEERLARFDREARLLAQLHHPHIASIFGVEETEGGRALVMELVEGATLAERIAAGPLPLEEALTIAGQIAEALEEAHEKGIVHRDLKPQNVKITPDGKVKVLDFGLAKALDPASGVDSAAQVAHSPTLTLGATVQGMIMGTAAYMSPEQAKGQPADKRSDIWAFGVVLYEMLVGNRLFAGDSVPETLAGVLKTEIDLELLPGELPAPVTRLLRRCLTRDPRRRLRDVGDARLELADAVAEGPATAAPTGAAAPPRSRRREVLAWSAAGVAVLAALGIALRPAPPVPESRPVRFELVLPEDHLLAYTDAQILALSPDGRQLAFVAEGSGSPERMIYLRALDEMAIRAVPGTAGAAHPLFSPDGRSLAFFTGSKLMRIPFEGGSPLPLADAPNPRGAAWAPDGSIIYSPGYAAGLWRVPASGGTPELLVEPDAARDERTYRWPDLLPDGRTAIVTIGFNDSPNDYENAEIAAISLATGERVTLVERASMARFVPPDRLLFVRQPAVYSVALDPDRLEVRGDPVPVLDGVGGDAGSGVAYLAASADGSLAYVPGAGTSRKSFVTIVERGGGDERLDLAPDEFYFPRFSPDGRQIALNIGGGFGSTAGAIWLYSSDSGALNRVTFGGSDNYPAFTPDGRWLSFLRGGEGVFRRPADGSGAEELVRSDQGGPALPESWSPDGRTVAVTLVTSSTDVYLVEPGGESRLFEANAASPVFSPDGRWLAYHQPAAGAASVFVRPVEGEGKWQLSPQLGGYPRWAADGRELYYIDTDPAARSLVRVDVEAGETILRAGPPEVVVPDLAARFLTSASPGNNWDVSRDGRRFVFIEPERDESARGRIDVVLHWTGQRPDDER